MNNIAHSQVIHQLSLPETTIRLLQALSESLNEVARREDRIAKKEIQIERADAVSYVTAQEGCDGKVALADLRHRRDLALADVEVLRTAARLLAAQSVAAG